MEKLKTIIEEIYRNTKPGECQIPAKNDASRFINELFNLLYPNTLPRDPEEYLLRFREIDLLFRKLLKCLQKNLVSSVDEVADTFYENLPVIYRKLWMDAEAIYKFDPAATSVQEVVNAYPGFFAITVYRIAHQLRTQGVPVFPRMIAEYAHSLTGIDINPGATIGESFFIDHGTGIVIGETTHIGNNVKIYQGVTLGALTVEKSLAPTKRHPTIEDNVIIYAGSTVLGGKTVIGHDSVIGGNVWLTESIPPYSVAYHKSEVRIRNNKSFDAPLSYVI